MTAGLMTALVFTVALLVVHGYFLAGSVPLLILKHDVPMDSRFVRGFYDIYYLAAMVIAIAAAASYLLAGRAGLAAIPGVLAVLTAVLRRRVIPTMDALRQRMQADDATAVGAFRRIHFASILLNLAQLVVLVASLITVSIQLKR